MATILAKSKYGKNFRVSVEDKHGYHNWDSQVITLNATDRAGYSGTFDNNGYCIGTNNVSLYDLSRQIVITQGTADNQRVGNKVYMKFLHFTYTIRLAGDTLLTYLNHGTNADMFMRFRVMVVKFDNGLIMTRPEIVNWFRETYIYFRQQTLSAGAGALNVPYQSIHQTKLRESTEWTGKFKILYDKKIKMGKKKTVKISNISIPIKQNLSFDNNNNQVTDDNFQNIFAFIIGPGCNELDTDAISADKIYNWNGVNRGIAATNAVLKWEYYDI